MFLHNSQHWCIIDPMTAGFHSDEHEKFQAVLRGVRAERDLTQAEVARKMSIPQGRVSRFESGQRRMDLVELRRWCLAVGVSMEEIVRRFDEAVRSDE